MLCATCRSENMGAFNYCSHCGAQPYRGPPIPRDPHARPVNIDTDKLQARRAAILAKVETRPGQQRKSKIADEFDAFILSYSGGRRGWSDATADDVFDWCCFLDSQGRGTTWVHDAACPGVGSTEGEACTPISGCSKQYAAGSIDKGFVSKLRMAMREILGKVEDWDPVQKQGNPCSSPLVESYLTCVNNTQRQVGVPVKQATPLLTHDFARLLQDLRQRAQSESLTAARIEITRDIALFALAFDSMRRGYDLSFTMGSQVLRLPESAGLIFNFLFGKTLRRSTEAVVVLADKECPQVCAFRAVTEYISAAKSIGWDLTKGYLFPVVLADGGRGPVALSAPRMTAALQGHLRAAGMPDHFTMHSFRVGGSVSKSLAGTAVDEIMKIGGWKTERIAKYYIGSTSSGRVRAPKRKRDHDYANASNLPLSPAFESDFSAFAAKYA